MGETKDHFRRLYRIATNEGIGNAIGYDVVATLARIGGRKEEIMGMTDVEIPSLYLKPCLVRDPYYWVKRFPDRGSEPLKDEDYKDYCTRTGRMHPSELERFKGR